MTVFQTLRYPLLNPAQRFVLRYGAHALGVIFMLHRVHPRIDHPWCPNERMKVSPDFLESLIAAYRRQGFEFISLDTLHDRIRLNRVTDKPFVALTLDDGYRDNYEIAFPLFKKLSVPFAVYITSDFPDRRAILWWYVLENLIDRADRLTLGDGRSFDCSTARLKNACFFALRSGLIHSSGNVDAALKALFPGRDWEAGKLVDSLALSWEQIVDMSRHPLCTIGGHSRTHAAFNRLSPADLEREVREGNAVIESHIQKKIDHFSYPFGSRREVGPREFGLLQPLGFKTVTRAGGGVVTRYNGTRTTALPRMMLNDNGGLL